MFELGAVLCTTAGARWGKQHPPSSEPLTVEGSPFALPASSVFREAWTAEKADP